ncbi:RfbX Membrane protein involved in the export of O-antigen and teichoic acid [Flavobacteriaceae bacterium]
MLQKLKNNHLLMSGFYKGVSGLSLFLSIPLLIRYFGDTNYGLWVMVFALFQWVFSMDFGLSSVLKTKIPVLIYENKIDFVKSYIIATYKITTIISFFIFLSFFCLLQFIDLKTILNIPFFDSVYINNLFLLNVFLFCLNFIFNVQKSLFVAFLKGKYSEQSIAVNQIVFLLTLLFIVYFFPDINYEQKLILISIANGIVGLLINGLYTVYFFWLEKLNLRTNIASPKGFISEIIRLGSKYMIIQIGLLFVFTSDNYILSNAFGPKEVVPYEIVNKLFQFPMMIIFAALSPLWSMFAKDYSDKNHLKLLSKFKKFNYSFVVISILIIILALICPFIISVWIKQKINIPENLILYVAIVTALRIFVSFYSFFLYGVEKINTYIIVLILSILIKIPLTFFLIHLGFGINSVAIATLLIMLVWTIIIPFQCYKLINKIK